MGGFGSGRNGYSATVKIYKGLNLDVRFWPKRSDMNMKSCICGESKPFAKCCNRFLSGKQNAKTPEQLIRSRFSTYALGGYGEYLISTWLPASAKGLR